MQYWSNTHKIDKMAVNMYKMHYFKPTVYVWNNFKMQLVLILKSKAIS